MLDQESTIKITRVANACVLIQIGGHFILTDPFFINWPMIGIKERIALMPEELPPLTAIIGCHDFIDHWQMTGLKKYPHNKDDVKVIVAMKGQARSAERVGFHDTQVLKWGHEVRLRGNLTIESVEAQKMAVWTVNNYVIRCGTESIFFGSEAREIAPLKKYREENGPIDVALLPTNAVHLFGFYKLVMGGDEAAKATQVLGARNLIVIHDSHPAIPGFIHIKSSGAEAEKEAEELDFPPVLVHRIPTGRDWKFYRPASLKHVS